MAESFLDFFNYSKTILCMCPECNHISRLNELPLRAKGMAPKTWLDDYESNVSKVDDQVAKFEEEEEGIREKARALGRAQVPKLVRQSMDKQFAKLEYNPYDIKALLHPIDFVVFDGMTDKEMKDVVFLAKSTTNQYLQNLQSGIAKTVQEKAYDWKVVRVTQDGQVEIE